MPKNERDLIASNDLVNEATRRYMKGEIPLAELHEVEKEYGIRYSDIFDELSIGETYKQIKETLSSLLQ